MMIPLIADDHDLFIDLLATHIGRTWADSPVYKATDVDAALKQLDAHPEIDIALLDVVMPGMNGLEGLARIKQARPDMPVALLSGQSDRAVIEQGLQMGAAGFVPKTISGDALIQAIRLMRSGEIYVPYSLMNRPAEHPQEPAGDDTLSTRETQVLDGLWRGLSNKEIARELNLQEVTVKLHLRRLYRKFECRNRTEALRIGLERGLLKNNA
ncbi:response regulator transcription factor [Rhodovibrio salinarum]|uniref:DNA-binding response regulator n=1 Tax=Rhodovibrio salinarum TaxID=1087 RepID=A0A934QJA2_9PROT|nr:response regulator transcription factor [Rhodovibrio salinarum]MBK1697470.1 DNA-binding response regulator [Rhodovibrio salinarum]